MSNEFAEEFNTLLTGEISAVETYDLALQKATTGALVETLRSCRDSHATRVERLTSRVLDAGGEPARGAGIWGPLAAWSQKSVSEENDALALLEQAEAERLVQYEAGRELVKGPVLTFIETELLPAQHETHLALSALLKQVTPITK